MAMEGQIFITGSTGFIGEQLVKQLVNKGNFVNLLVRNPSNCKFQNKPRVKIFQGDLMDVEAIRTGMSNCTQVYHLAGLAKSWRKNSQDYYDTNVNGTQNILESAKDLKVEKVVVTSTCSVLGPSISNPINENSPRTIPLFNDYEKSKHEMESLVKKFVSKGLNIVVVSPARVYGPGPKGDCNVVVEIIEKYLAGKWRFIPARESIGSYSYIDDVVNGHIQAMEKGVKGEHYILGGDNRKFRELFTIVRRVTGIKFSLYRVPVPIILLISFVESKISSLFKRKPLLPYKWSSKLTYDWAVSSEKAQMNLGYSITPFEDGLKKTIYWIKEAERDSKFKVSH